MSFHPCPKCGRAIRNQRQQCLNCYRSEQKRERFERWARIATLWAEGVPMRDICPQVNRLTVNSLKVEMDRMKKAGWNLPPRRAGWKGNPNAHHPPRKPLDAQLKANQRLNYELSKGRVSRPNHCERCGGAGPLDGHHEDYSRPLDVNWLCRRCHAARHRELKAVAA